MADYDPLDTKATSRERAGKARAARKKREQEQEDIRWLMHSKQGRRITSRLLGVCGVYRSSFTGDRGQTDFREGMRNVGLILLADVHSLAPEDFVLMLKEHGNDSSSDTSSTGPGTDAG